MVLVGLFYEVLSLMYISWDKCIYADDSLDGRFSFDQSPLEIVMDIMALWNIHTTCPATCGL